MYNTLLGQGEETIADFGDKLHCFLFIEDSSRLGLEVVLEIGFAELLDDVIVVGTFHYIVKANNVWGVHSFHDFDL